jgi:hypothetical protein
VKVTAALSLIESPPLLPFPKILIELPTPTPFGLLQPLGLKSELSCPDVPPLRLKVAALEWSALRSRKNVVMAAKKPKARTLNIK